MAAEQIENGKKIEELLEVDTLPSSSYFMVSTNDLARRINIRNLRKAFNGDTATSNLNNLYYSCEKINEFLDGIDNELDRISDQFINVNKRLDLVFDTFGADLSELQNRIEQIYTELTLADENIRNDIVAKYNTLVNVTNSLAERVGTNETNISNLGVRLTNLSNTVSANYTDLNKKITDIKTILGDVTGITIGTSVPTTLPKNAIYLQYFTD